VLPLLAALVWMTPADPRLVVNGLPWLVENQHELIRLPKRLESELPKAVWNLGLSPAGGRIRFRTNSTSLVMRLEYPSPPNMTNMSDFGQTGVDLYLDGVYRITAVATKDAEAGKVTETVLFKDLPAAEREVTLYLPLYKPVKVIGIGVDEQATLKAPARFAVAKPVVFYGTSITQGGCASRPGMSYQAILGRELNLDHVNLGFSGNGRGEPVVARTVAELDASLFVLDFSQNNPTPESLMEVYEPFLATLRAKHPHTPILAITAIAAANNPPRLVAMRDHIRKVVTARIAAGDKNLTLVDGLSLMSPAEVDGTVDGVHPNDLGFQRMAERLAPTVAEILKQPPVKLVDDREIVVTSAAAVERKRTELIEFIWGPAGFPKGRPAKAEKGVPSPVAGLTALQTVERFTIQMPAGQENTTHLLTPKQPNGRLIVLHHGHACTFDDAGEARGGGMANTTARFLEAGYSVLLAHMPHFRPGDCAGPAHRDLFALPVGEGSALKLFFDPVAQSLNAVRRRYRRVDMVGLSGGGWTTTVYAALDPAIRASFSVAGAVPLHLRTLGSVGDLEQFLPAFYRRVGYPDLFVMGAMGRQQTHIYNRRDNCCFGEAQHHALKLGAPYAEAYRGFGAAVQQTLGTKGEFRVEIDETATHHMISPWAVERILAALRQ
jgi:lysophospholipase L1-like esterase/pimeloyl-ACP methyl ester carboxylesterase